MDIEHSGSARGGRRRGSGRSGRSGKSGAPDVNTGVEADKWCHDGFDQQARERQRPEAALTDGAAGGRAQDRGSGRPRGDRRRAPPPKERKPLVVSKLLDHALIGATDVSREARGGSAEAPLPTSKPPPPTTGVRPEIAKGARSETAPASSAREERALTGQGNDRGRRRGKGKMRAGDTDGPRDGPPKDDGAGRGGGGGDAKRKSNEGGTGATDASGTRARDTTSGSKPSRKGPRGGTRVNSKATSVDAGRACEQPQTSLPPPSHDAASSTGASKARPRGADVEQKRKRNRRGGGGKSSSTRAKGDSMSPVVDALCARIAALETGFAVHDSRAYLLAKAHGVMLPRRPTSVVVSRVVSLEDGFAMLDARIARLQALAAALC